MSDLRAAAATLSDLALHRGDPALAEAARAVREALAEPQALPAGMCLMPVDMPRGARLYLLNGESSWNALIDSYGTLASRPQAEQAQGGAE